MSYILDALKRAETERSRDRLPDIHDALLGAPASDKGRPGRTRAGLWIVIGLVGGLLVAGAMQLAANRTTRDRAAHAPAAPFREASPGASASAASVAAAPPSGDSTTSATPVFAADAAPPGPPTLVVPTAAPASQPTSSAPFLPPAARPPASATRAPAAVMPAAAPASALPVAVAAPTDPGAPAAVVAWRDLPASVRQQLPTLKLSGSIHSERRADRLLIVDGQLVREGETVAPGLVLEQIGQRAAVFRQGALRFELPL